MHYYDPNDKAPRRWAVIAAAAYAVSLAASFVLVSFDLTPPAGKQNDTILVDFTEPPRPEPEAPSEASDAPRTHDRTAPAEQTAQTQGEDAATATPDPRTLFRMNRSGADEPEHAGNPQAREGEEQNRGSGSGMDPAGMDQLDKGLQGRGLAGDLPKPSYPGTKSGKIVVRVTVGPGGDVTSASYEAVGSTVSDPELVDAALAAARKARFTESRAAVQGGTITYVFRME